jgi:hypothetical protein
LGEFENQQSILKADANSLFFAVNKRNPYIEKLLAMMNEIKEIEMDAYLHYLFVLIFIKYKTFSFTGMAFFSKTLITRRRFFHLLLPPPPSSSCPLPRSIIS